MSKTYYIPLIFFGTILGIFILIFLLVDNIRRSFIKIKIKYLLKNLSSDCFLEINHYHSQIELKPKVNTNHGLIVASEHQEKFMHKYNEFFKIFLKEDSEEKAIGGSVRIYKENKKILLNFYKFQTEEIKLQKIY